MRNRFARRISTGILIDAQGGGDLDNSLDRQAMINMGKAQGIAESDIEVGYCTDAELQIMIEEKQAAADLAHPLKKWKRDMAESDNQIAGLSGGLNYTEETIVDMLVDKFPNILDEAGNESIKAKHGAKKILRNSRP